MDPIWNILFVPEVWRHGLLDIEVRKWWLSFGRDEVRTRSIRDAVVFL